MREQCAVWQQVSESAFKRFFHNNLVLVDLIETVQAPSLFFPAPNQFVLNLYCTSFSSALAFVILFFRFSL